MHSSPKLAKKLFLMTRTPMVQALLQSTSLKNVRVMPVEPEVKSAKTCKLFNAGVSEISQIEKSADPTCYNSLTVNETGLFDMESAMDVKQARRLKVGDRVSYGTDPTGPDYGDRGTVTKRYPACYIVEWDDGLVIQYMDHLSMSINRV